jgi:hypothetical protein
MPVDLKEVLGRAKRRKPLEFKDAPKLFGGDKDASRSLKNRIRGLKRLLARVRAPSRLCWGGVLLLLPRPVCRPSPGSPALSQPAFVPVSQELPPQARKDKARMLKKLEKQVRAGDGSE